MKKTILMILTLFFSVCAFISNGFAESVVDEKLSANKTAVKQDNAGEYEIGISVPKKYDEKYKGYNFIIVIDASTSINNTKWTKTREAVLNIASTLLPKENSNLNVNHVALITFGIGSHVNIPLTNDLSKFEELPIKGGTSLLEPGRSATNNEVGLRGAREYLESLKGTDLERPKEYNYVIYLTDGNSNMNERPVNFYQIVQDEELIRVGGKYQNSLDIQKDGVIAAVSYFDIVISDEEYENVERMEVLDTSLAKLRETYLKYYPEDIEASADKMFYFLEKDYPEVSHKLLVELINDFYDAIGYNKTKSYSAGDYERLINKNAFIDRNIHIGYAKVNGVNQFIVNDEPTYNGTKLNAVNPMIEDLFYYPIFYVGGNRIENATRAIAEGIELAQISTVFTVGINAYRDDALRILDPNYSANQNIEHYSSKYINSNINELLLTFKNLLNDFIEIKYSDVEVVDYTSKWVLPIDVNDDGVFDAMDITLKNGGTIIDNPEDYIEVIKINQEEYNNSNDIEIKGNDNGDIYKITWKVTEYLNSWDNYSISYRVKVDTQEKGFISNQEYKANGDTTINYSVVEIDNGEETTIAQGSNEIIVPTVKQEENVLIVVKKDENNNLLNGSDFDIVGDYDKQIIKEYSEDAINWTKENNNATYFKFSGLYDCNYTLSETLAPNGYHKTENMIVDFINKEKEVKEIDVINKKIKYGQVNVKYVDENNNPLTNEIDLEELVGTKYETIEKTFEDYILLKVIGNTNGEFVDGKLEVIYVYEFVMGQGDGEEENIPSNDVNNEIYPPQTGLNEEIDNFNSFIFILIVLVNVAYFTIKKIIKE